MIGKWATDRPLGRIVPALAAGLVSAGLGVSGLLSAAFLLPIQFAYGREGAWAGLTASGMALAVLAVLSVALGAPTGAAGAASVLAEVLPFALPLGALAFINVGPARRFSRTARILLAVAVISLIVAPFAARMLGDASLKAWLEGSFGALLERGGAAMPAGLPAELDLAAVVAFSLEALASSYAALLLLFIGGSWWLGNRLAGAGSVGGAEVPRLGEFRLPESFVWPFLASFAGLLAALALKAGMLERAVAWNLSLVFALVYAAQGMGIIAHLLQRPNVPRAFRIAFAASLVLSALSPLGLVLAAILSLLGVTEQWVPYRRAKGVGA